MSEEQKSLVYGIQSDSKDAVKSVKTICKYLAVILKSFARRSLNERPVRIQRRVVRICEAIRRNTGGTLPISRLDESIITWTDSTPRRDPRGSVMNNANEYYPIFILVRCAHTVFHKDQFYVPYFFLLYINDLSRTINKKSKPILFADDTSIIFTNFNSEDF
jgi:hypothetical protein